MAAAPRSGAQPRAGGAGAIPNADAVLWSSSPFLGARAAANVRGENEQFRAELKPRLFRDIEVEVEPHRAALDEDLRDTDAGEVVCVADGENGCAVEAGRDRFELRPRQ